MTNLKIVTGLIALFMFAGAAGLATAQDTTQTTHKKTRKLTGYLQKNDHHHVHSFYTDVHPQLPPEIVMNAGATPAISRAAGGYAFASFSSEDKAANAAPLAMQRIANTCSLIRSPARSA